MIRHMVLFKVKPFVSQDAIDNAFQWLFELQYKLSGIVSMTGGKCVFHEGKGAGFITHGFCIDFEDEGAYRTFLEDPITHPAKVCILNITEGGFQGLYGFDIGGSLTTYPNPLDKYRIPIPRLLPKGAIR